MIIIAGLGNPGKEYSCTRHNFGFILVDALSNHWNIKLKTNKSLSSIVGKTIFSGHEIIVAKPLVYMNNSGSAIKKLTDEFSVTLSDTLVLNDDFALPYGKIRLRLNGSSGGHKGLQSIIDVTGNSSFPRLRLGIGPVPESVDPKGFVLSEFNADEKKTANKIIEEAVLIIEKFVNGKK